MSWFALTNDGRRGFAAACRVSGRCLTVLGYPVALAGVVLGAWVGWTIGTDITAMPQWTAFLWVPITGVVLIAVPVMPGVFMLLGGLDLRSKAAAFDAERRRS